MKPLCCVCLSANVSVDAVTFVHGYTMCRVHAVRRLAKGLAEPIREDDIDPCDCSYYTEMDGCPHVHV